MEEEGWKADIGMEQIGQQKVDGGQRNGSGTNQREDLWRCWERRGLGTSFGARGRCRAACWQSDIKTLGMMSPGAKTQDPLEIFK